VCRFRGRASVCVCVCRFSSGRVSVCVCVCVGLGERIYSLYRVKTIMSMEVPINLSKCVFVNKVSE